MSKFSDEDYREAFRQQRAKLSKLRTKALKLALSLVETAEFLNAAHNALEDVIRLVPCRCSQHPDCAHCRAVNVLVNHAERTLERVD